jgi:hypothetical protein
MTMLTYKNAALPFVTQDDKLHYADLTAFAYADVSAGITADGDDALAITWFIDHVAPTLKLDANGGFDRSSAEFRAARATYKAAGQQAYRDADITYQVTVEGEKSIGQKVALSSAQCLCDKQAFMSLEGPLKVAIKERRDALNNVIDARWSRLLGKASGGAKTPQTWNEFMTTISEMVLTKQKSFDKKGAPTTSAARIEGAMLALMIVEAPSDI